MAEPPDETRGFEAVLSAIVSGAPVDWESTTRIADTAESRAVLDQLRILERICHVHAGELTGALAAWGHLALLGHIGRGASSQVYRAWDSRLDREVALKLLDGSGAADGGAAILAEARALARVRHPNVATVYGADVIGGQVGLWLELVRGRTLEAIVTEHGTLGPREAALIGIDLCRALAAIHGANLLHRDVKTQNVMREDGGRTVLMDFGSASDVKIDAAGVAGTPLYIAPEVLAGGKATPASDLYSLGVVLFRLVSGGFPTAGRTVGDIARAHSLGIRTWLRDLRADIDDGFGQVVEGALQPDPARRFGSAGEMEQALRAVVHDAADPTLGTAPAATAVDRFRAIPRAITVAATLLIVTSMLLVRPLTRLGGGRGDGDSSPAGPRSPLVVLSSQSSRTMLTRQSSEPWAFLVAGRPSADGRIFSFPQGPGDLAVFDFATGRSFGLTDVKETEEEVSFSVPSRNGEWIAYTWRALDGVTELRLIDRAGRHPRVLLREPAMRQVHPFDWSPASDGVLCATIDKDERHRLAIVDIASRRVTTLLNLSATPAHAAISPDGRQVAFDAPISRTSTARAISLLDLDSGTVHPAIVDPHADRGGMWTAAGDLVFFSDRLGNPSLWRQRMRNGNPEGAPSMLARDFPPVVALGLSTDGTLFYAAQSRPSGIYRATRDPRTGRWNPPVPLPGPPSSLTIWPAWSPNGHTIAYISVSSSTTDGDDAFGRSIVLVDTHSGIAREMVVPRRLVSRPRWSPDSRSLLVSSADSSDHWHLDIVDVASGAPLGRPFAAFDDGPPEAGWSENGRAVRYFAAGTLMECDVATTTCAAVRSRSDSAGPDPLPNTLDFGRRGTIAAAFDVEHGRTEVRVADTLGQWRTVASLEGPRISGLAWTVDEEALLVTACQPHAESCGLWTIDPATGRTEQTNLAMPELGAMSMAPIGDDIVFSSGVFQWDVWMLRDFLP